jgi:hemolysin activation/secretion protein
MQHERSLTARFSVWAFAITLITHAAQLAAQQSSSPAQIDQRFKPQSAQPSVGPAIEIPEPQQRRPTSQSDASLHFTLSSISFPGNTVLPEAKLQRLATAYVGYAVTLDQLNELADQITAAYRDAGYILSRAVVPPQRVTDGHLVVNIIEGFVDTVKIEGSVDGAHGLLQAYGQKITATRPLTNTVLERELLLATDIADLGVRSVLTPSATAGAADLTFVVAPKDVEAYLSVDNRGSKYLGPYETMGGVFFNQAFGTAGRLGLNAVVTPERGTDLAYGAMSFDAPIGVNGLRLFSTASYTSTRPGSVLRALNTRGNALNLAGTLSYPMIRSRDLNLSISSGLALHNVRSSNAVVSPLFSDHVRAINLGVFFNALDDLAGYSTVTVTLTQGLDVLGATSRSSLNKSHANATGDFTRVELAATRAQPLFDWLTLSLGVGGQTSFGKSLLASEQYSLGGNSFNRAFDPSEATGDKALAGRAELQWSAIDQVGVFSRVAIYGFYEGGQVWQAKPLPGELPSESLFSLGAGLRFLLANRCTADVEWARPLERDVAANANRKSRVFFSLSANF